jgi:DNA modification methylase
MSKQPTQLKFDKLLEQSNKVGKNGYGFSDPAFGVNKQAALHRWVPWIAGFSKDFVAESIVRYVGDRKGLVLDPFAGVGTTLVESLLHGHDTVGFEINPYAALACRVKTNAHHIDPILFRQEINRFIQFCSTNDHEGFQPVTQSPLNFKTRAAFYSPIVLRKVLTCLDFFATIDDPLIKDLFKVAFAATMVKYSNYSYEPSLARRVSSGKEAILDYKVFEAISIKLEEMAVDIEWVRESLKDTVVTGNVVNRSFFECREVLDPESVDLVITSPPYLNNYHYNRNTRPQLYWLDLVQNPDDMKPFEMKSFGKFWQTVREEEKIDLEFNLPNSDLQERIDYLRTLRSDKGVYGGNGWANYAATYFNDSWKFSECLKYVLKKDATALVVIGNNILQGEVFATDQYLGQIAKEVGLELVDIHIPRTTRVGSSIVNSSNRNGNTSSAQLYEAVVELRKS